MPSSKGMRKFYLQAPDLEFRVNGPIKIGNVITDLTLPQDPITVFKPLPEIIPGAEYSKGKTSSNRHTSLAAELSTKLYDVFGGQAEGKRSNSIETTYAFDKISSLYLERNPNASDVKMFREGDEEFRNALRDGPVYIITGLKIASGLEYSNSRTRDGEMALGGDGHITQDVAVEGHLSSDVGTENIDSWTVLGDPIIAYRVHIVKRQGWLWKGKGDLTTQTHDPGDAGFMSSEDEVDEVEMTVDDVSSDHLDFYAEEQGFEGVRYWDVSDGLGVEDWCFAVLQG